jgi:hypothetical protein
MSKFERTLRKAGAVIVRRNKTVHVTLGGKTVSIGEHTKENPYIHITTQEN